MAIAARRDAGIDPTAKISAEQLVNLNPFPTPLALRVLGFEILQSVIAGRTAQLHGTSKVGPNESHLNKNTIKRQG